MDQSSQPPRPDDPPSDPSTPPVGRVSEFLGRRLVLIGLVAGVLGLALLVFAGIKLWLVVARGSLGSDAVSLVVGGCLAYALLSIGSSARRTGLQYLGGRRTVPGDMARFVARRIERRRRARGG